MAAHLIEAAEEDSCSKTADSPSPERPIEGCRLTDVAKAFFAPVGITAHFGLGLDGVGFSEAAPPNFPNGCHACEVEVDPETGSGHHRALRRDRRRRPGVERDDL